MKANASLALIVIAVISGVIASQLWPQGRGNDACNDLARIALDPPDLSDWPPALVAEWRTELAEIRAECRKQLR